MSHEALRNLPSVEALLVHLEGLGHERGTQLTDAARQILGRARDNVLAGDGPAPPLAELADLVEHELARRAMPSLHRVINASGVILQTNLGRAPLSERAMAAMREVAMGYSNLEYDTAAGARGSRHEHVRGLISAVTGAEDGIAVNNNAAAIMMVLQVFAAGREVIVSRGQAVEIGGGFRIPDVLRQSGAKLVEVGTTNRTYARDYADAITPDTAALLRVHASNFQVIGFTAEPALGELAAIARDRGVLLLDDLGSGCLVETRDYWLAHEPTVQETIAAGVDLAMFSGDKLLGGPQAGIIAGRSDLIERLRRHPLARALRLDKTAIAALNATLMSYVASRERQEIPVWRMLATPGETLRARAEALMLAIGSAAEVVQCRTMVGGGSLPGQGVDSWGVRFRAPAGAAVAAQVLRTGAHVPVVARVADDAVIIDLRTVEPDDDRYIAEVVRAALGVIA